jgi:hypothetical protein
LTEPAAQPDPSAGIPASEREVLRERVLQHLRMQGFAVANGRLLAPVNDDKDRLRALHDEAVASKREKARGALTKHEDLFLHRLARPDRIDVDKIDPELVLVSDRRSFDGLLWRWCSLHWSIPVSSGYGRRLRFIVRDRGNNGAVMGLIGLGDPVFSLGARDKWIGWNAETRRHRLANVMDAFVLGAVPPYNNLRAGKLMGLLATSAEVRDAFADRYGHRTTVISERDPDARLAVVTTTSALGRSSVYNRLTAPDGALAFLPLGYTTGSGDFHLSGAIYEALAEHSALVNTTGVSHGSSKWKSSGPRNRREVIQRSLEDLGLDSRALRLHGVRRQVFAAPLMSNAPSYLNSGEEPSWTSRPAQDLADHWASRWARPRAARDDAWRDFDRQTWRLYTEPNPAPALSSPSGVRSGCPTPSLESEPAPFATAPLRRRRSITREDRS